MQLEGYELLDLAVEDGIAVSKVRDQKTGSLRQIHAFHGALIADFDKLSLELLSTPPDQSKVVRVTKERGVGYIVTEVLPDGTGIRGWIAGLRQLASSKESPSL